MRARVKARGLFHNQEVEVLRIEKKQRWYQLAVTWQGTVRPSWFKDVEIELLEEEPQTKQESEAR